MISSRRDWLPPPLVGAEVGREGRGMMSGDMVWRCDSRLIGCEVYFFWSSRKVCCC